jgi:hypothetical protein
VNETRSRRPHPPEPPPPPHDTPVGVGGDNGLEIPKDFEIRFRSDTVNCNFSETELVIEILYQDRCGILLKLPGVFRI